MLTAPNYLMLFKNRDVFSAMRSVTRNIIHSGVQKCFGCTFGPSVNPFLGTHTRSNLIGALLVLVSVESIVAFAPHLEPKTKSLEPTTPLAFQKSISHGYTIKTSQSCCYSGKFRSQPQR